MNYSATFGAGREDGKQDNRLENLMVNFAKLGGCKMPWVKIQQLVTKPDLDTGKWKEYLGK